MYKAIKAVMVGVYSDMYELARFMNEIKRP